MLSLQTLLIYYRLVVLFLATMPSVVTKNTPFQSLRPDHRCGREEKTAVKSNGYKNLLNGGTNGLSNGHTDRSTNASTDEDVHDEDELHDDHFLRLAEPQQDILLLHGPRQKYSLAKAQDIPTLKDDREILVQVLAIGLNPVDWKGADYDFGQPSYPW